MKSQNISLEKSLISILIAFRYPATDCRLFELCWMMQHKMRAVNQRKLEDIDPMNLTLFDEKNLMQVIRIGMDINNTNLIYPRFLTSHHGQQLFSPFASLYFHHI
jgi:hypothetical protein